MNKLVLILSLFLSLTVQADFNSIIKVAIIDDFSHANSHGHQVSEVFNTYKGNLSFKPEVIELNVSNSVGYDTEKMVKLATELKVNVINLSLGEMDLGYTEFNNNLFKALKKASDQGIWIVTAAGNNGDVLSVKNPMYPCMFKIERLICVGASQGNQINPISNKGYSVFVYADGSYKRTNMTSFATPRISQAIALFLENKKGFNFDKELLLYSMNDKGIVSLNDFYANLKYEHTRRTTASLNLPF